MRGSLQLLDSMDKFENSPPVPGDNPVEGNPVAMPYGFMEQFSTEYEEEGLQEIIEPIGEASLQTICLPIAIAPLPWEAWWSCLRDLTTKMRCSPHLFMSV